MNERKNIQDRYLRVYDQLKDLLTKTDDPIARMSTIVAVLHHKFDSFFWTGFYWIKNGELIVASYQGPVACQVLKKDTGVCWASINKGETLIVPDVEKFPGHIACSSLSKSEIVIPLKNTNDEIIGVLDIDSKELDSFDITDKEGLERIISLVFV